MTTKHPMVKVVWRDITSYDDWRSLNDPAPILEIESLGFLLENTEDNIKIAASLSDDTTGNLMVFPPSIVVSITQLRNNRKVRKA